MKTFRALLFLAALLLVIHNTEHVVTPKIINENLGHEPLS